MAAISFDPARKLTLYFRVARDGSKTFSFVDANGTAKDVSGYSFAFSFKYRASDSSNVFSIANGDLTRPSTDKITIPVSSTLTNVAPQEYYWQMDVTLPDTKVHTWLTGSAKFHNGEFDGVTETTSIIVDETSGGVTITISDTASPIAATQSEVDAGTVTNKYVSPSTLNDLDTDSVALVDGATIDLTGPKHTLTTALGRTFTNSHIGDFIVINITLSATSATFTFPAGYLCSFAGTASGDNTLAVTGATSGDIISVGIIKVGSQYLVSALNFGQ